MVEKFAKHTMILIKINCFLISIVSVIRKVVKFIGWEFFQFATLPFENILRDSFNEKQNEKAYNSFDDPLDDKKCLWVNRFTN